MDTTKGIGTVQGALGGEGGEGQNGQGLSSAGRKPACAPGSRSGRPSRPYSSGPQT